jgi:hypothetical protein
VLRDSSPASDTTGLLPATRLTSFNSTLAIRHIGGLVVDSFMWHPVPILTCVDSNSFTTQKVTQAYV